MPVWMGLTPYHGGGVPADRVKLISIFSEEFKSMSLIYPQLFPKSVVYADTGSWFKKLMNGMTLHVFMNIQNLSRVKSEPTGQ